MTRWGWMLGLLALGGCTPELEDLLGRDPVKLDLPLIGRFISERVVLVTGAAGSIGSPGDGLDIIDNGAET